MKKIMQNNKISKTLERKIVLKVESKAISMNSYLNENQVRRNIIVHQSNIKNRITYWSSFIAILIMIIGASCSGLINKKEIDPKKIKPLLSKANKKIVKISNNLYKEFNQKVEEYDIKGISLHMETLKKLQQIGFIDKLKMHSETYMKDFKHEKLVGYDKQKENLEERAEKVTENICKTPLLNEETRHNQKDRKRYFEQLNKKTEFVKHIEKSNYVENKDRYQMIEKDLDKKIDEQKKENIERVFTMERSSEKEIQKIDLTLNILNELVSQTKVCKEKAEKIRNETIENIKGKIKNIEKEILEEEENTDKIGKNIILLKKMNDNIISVRNQLNIEKKIDDSIQELQKSSDGITDQLFKVFNQDQSGIGSRLIAQNKFFAGKKNELFIKSTESRNIDVILKELKGDSIDKKILRESFNQYKKYYEEAIKNYLKPDLNLMPLIQSVITKVLSVTNVSKFEWGKSVNNILPEILGKISAIWTLNDAKDYFKVRKKDSNQIINKNYLKQPHTAQIVSVLRLLGIDSKNFIQNHLEEIETGNGKSVTIALTSVILSLFGYDVSCACYSEYLSSRDYQAFADFFDQFGVKDYINYGTFNQICENWINSEIDVRKQIVETVETSVKNKNFNNIIVKTKTQSKRDKILIIDEVDVFFQENFYGNQYRPVASLKDPTINKLNKFVWDNRSNITLDIIKNSQEFKDCCARYLGWEQLIEEASKDMIDGVKNCEDHNPIVKEGKIGYKENDGISFKTRYGHKTQFKARKEFELGNIELDMLENEYLAIYLSSGVFSYAEIPKKFKYILGVTGTLEPLNSIQKEIIKNIYNIKKSSYMPSLYSKGKFIFQPDKGDLKIVDQSTYHSTIKLETDNKLIGIQGTVARAVIIIFEDMQKLDDFYNSSIFAEYRDSAQKLLPIDSNDEKERKIRIAATKGQVTLTTREFGRGCDFICNDKIVKANGGTHVILTFMPLDKSEEIQCKGRTARQSDSGSFSMILLRESLEQFDINIKEEVDDMIKKSEYYEPINIKRNEKYVKIYKERIKGINNANKQHEYAEKFLNNLKKGNTSLIKKVLLDQNKGVQVAGVSRTIVLMDATYSMSELLEASKKTVFVMFKLMHQALKEKGYDDNIFQLQFAAYRNYGMPYDKLLEYSEWTSEINKLQKFLSNINVDGGWGNEAIEVGLQHSLREHKKTPKGIDQVILIGDAPSNTDEETKSKRSSRGESYWSQYPQFAVIAYTSQLIEVFAKEKIPIHCFYVAKRAEQDFKKTASKTGGHCNLLEINSSKGAHLLMDTIAENVLSKAVGGGEAGDEIIKTYKNLSAKVTV